MNEWSSLSNCNMAEWFPAKSSYYWNGRFAEVETLNTLYLDTVLYK